ncbi:MAG TPA: glycosyltransferase [Usitatibacter sp.]|jgi:glycosyltransferase involved in cell wall biosynthesis|nr:glycosyltransferase [Usitatibacter sp.]
MRVLFIISDLGFHGAQKQVVELSRGLAANGHAVAIYTLNGDAARAPELEGSGVELVTDQKRMKLDPGVLRRLNRFIRTFRADIVHGFLFDGDIYARIASIGTGALVFNSERSANYAISRTQLWAHRLTHGLVDAVVANSHAGARFAEKAYGYDPKRMHVIWNGMRIEEVEARGVSSKDYRREFFGPGDYRIACMIGHIKPAKDYPLALDVAATLVQNAPEWRVLFLGEALCGAAEYKPGMHSDTSDYKSRVLEKYHRLGLEDKVLFAGARADAPAILKQCDVQLITSAWEGFPNVVLEGMVLGVPVVSTDYSDIRQILPRMDQVVASRDPEELARAIVTVAADRAAVIAEQKRWVQSHAGIEKATQELERVYQRYLHPAPRALAARELREEG